MVRSGSPARRGTALLALLAAGSALAGCGTADVAVVEGTAPATPYQGPMSVPADPGDEEKPVLERSGAAGLALECDGPPSNGGAADYVEGDLYPLGDTAQEALTGYLDAEAGAYTLPDTGYRLEREEDGRALYSFDVDGRTKVAFVLADGMPDFEDRRGWGVESWAQCDLAELPESFTAALDVGVWTDEHGNRVATGRIRSFHGAEHCDWQDTEFLHLGDGAGLRQYVADVEGEFRRTTRGRYDSAATLPEDAVDTGLRRDGRQLWFDADRTAAYLVSVADPTDVERWPRADEPILCM